MANTSTARYSPAPDATRAPKSTPVADDKWVKIVQAFTKSLGPPELLKAGGPAQTVEEADEAKWGDEETGVHLVRGEPLTPAGSSIFLQADSMTEFKALMNDFKRLRLKVKDPVTTLVVYREGHFGLIRTETVTFGSFYLNLDKENIAGSDVVGVVDVGHNPPPKWSPR